MIQTCAWKEAPLAPLLNTIVCEKLWNYASGEAHRCNGKATQWSCFPSLRYLQLGSLAEPSKLNCPGMYLSTPKACDAMPRHVKSCGCCFWRPNIFASQVNIHETTLALESKLKTVSFNCISHYVWLCMHVKYLHEFYYFRYWCLLLV